MTALEAARPGAPLGHELFGSGPTRVVILNDWLCDTSTWDGARPYLDVARFTFAFTDLRGYGRSRGRAGSFTVAEGARDVLALVDALAWPRFAVVGRDANLRRACGDAAAAARQSRGRMGELPRS